MNTWGKKSLNLINKKGFNPLLKEFLIFIEKKLPFECSVTDTVRTSEEQAIHFKNGASKCDGYKIKSKHQSGNAFDIIPSKNKWNSTNEEFNQLSNVIKKEFLNFEPAKLQGFKIEWGGDWKNFIDKPHWELRIKK